MTEFSLIQTYCKDIGQIQPETVLSVGDDAAIVQVPNGKELVISVDTMVEGVHFFAESNPEHIAKKLVAVNLSDMAAMGATPKWATLALTISKIDEQWLSAFSTAMDSICKHYNVQLIGGDTCKGNLTLSLQIMGLIEQGEALTRNNAQLGDDLYVSGVLGDAAIALAVIQNKQELLKSDLDSVREVLDTPTPQVELGKHLVKFANSCIDISDGLVADVSHIAEQSELTVCIDVESLPISKTYSSYVSAGGNYDYALTGGEDYQLAFTVSPIHRPKLEALAAELKIKLTKIGSVIERSDQPVKITSHQQAYRINNNTGYQHFS